MTMVIWSVEYNALSSAQNDMTLRVHLKSSTRKLKGDLLLTKHFCCYYILSFLNERNNPNKI